MENVIDTSLQKENVIVVRQACKQYGSNKKPFIVLNKLNMTVQRGVIYGLLGASGCGKTTLLNCILGRKKLNSGEISVLGGIPGTKESSVPGPSVGYMPQELGLIGDLTIKEILRYFALLTDVGTEDEIKERSKFLLDLLMLPNADQEINTLSGGQQRRVSLAVTLIFRPELLILDEPTVGLDSLLRQKVWEHLISICKERQSTIIITTHYIEETRQADIISLMRNGYFLAEEPPDKLLEHFGAETLENVFLKLSILQNSKNNSNTGPLWVSNCLEDVDKHSEEIKTTALIKQNTFINGQESNMADNRSSFNLRHFEGILWKNFLWMKKNVIIIIFIIIMPIFQLSLFCLCIGHDPVNIPIAVVNYESNNSRYCHPKLECNSTHLGCTFLSYLEQRAIKLVHVKDENIARNLVVKGKMYGSIVIKHNYSLSIRKRVPKWFYANKQLVNDSFIEVLVDESSK